MAKRATPLKLLSVVVPLYNEADALRTFHSALTKALKSGVKGDYEIIYVDDGSLDGTDDVVRSLRRRNNRVKLLKLSRNFGKESALTAGITAARGQAIAMLDGDCQHPVELLPIFVEEWQNGAQVVVGVRRNDRDDSWVKRWGSKLFYKAFNKMASQKLLPGSTDFRLIDSTARAAFLRLNESDRITRGLIDWVGFRREYVYFDAGERQEGAPGYSFRKLAALATHSFVSLTPAPLYLFGYLGFLITFLSLILGLVIILEQLILGDPWHWHFTGTAMLGVLIIFLVGVLLIAQGILSLYISHIQTLVKQRPLYIVDYEASAGLRERERA
jgi:glycosyltransferase involved in cell wall biosynthesis